MRLNKLTAAILFSAIGFPIISSAANVTANDETNTFSGLDYSMMITKDGGHTWSAYTNASQNNFPGTVLAQVAQKQELAIISEDYDPNRTYKGGDTVRFLGYYWTAQWWVDQGISPSTDPVWKQGDKIDFTTYATFQFTPYTGQNAIDLQNREKARVAAQRKVIGYFPEWGVYEAHNFFTPDKVDYSGLSHLNYGFAVVKDGVVTMHDTDKAPSLIKDLDKRTEAANVTHMISIGGWNNSQEGVFETATATDAGLDKLANSMVSYMTQWNFDGLDIDWEYPDTEVEKAQFTKLIQSLRTKLDAQGLKDDKYYQLSAAVTTNHNNIQFINPAVTTPLLDSVNVMAYDIHGAFDPLTGHNAPLYENSHDEDKDLNVADTMAAYATTWNVPKAKLMMGIPYYGRGWGHVPGTEIIAGLPGMFNTGAATVKGAWDDGDQLTGTNPWYVLKQKLASGDYTRYWDSESHVPYLYSKTKQEFLTYDDPQSIREKVDFINAQGFGGAILWDISGDTPEHELGNIVETLLSTPLPTPDPTPNPDPTPDPTPDPKPAISVIGSVKDFGVVIKNGTPSIHLTLDRAAHEAKNMNYTIEINNKFLGKSQYNECTNNAIKDVNDAKNTVTCSWTPNLKGGDKVYLYNYSNGVTTPIKTIMLDKEQMARAEIAGELISFDMAIQSGKPALVLTETDSAYRSYGNYTIELNGKFVGKIQKSSVMNGSVVIDAASQTVKGTWKPTMRVGDKIKLHRYKDGLQVDIVTMTLTDELLSSGGNIYTVFDTDTAPQPDPTPDPDPQPQPQPSPVKGLKATLFQNSGYTGDSLEITGDIDCLKGLKMKNGFEADNEVSSLTLPKGSLGIRLFPDCQFKGKASSYQYLSFQSEYDMTKSGTIMNKAASSVQVVKAEAREASYDRGGFLKIYGDIPSLRTEKRGDYSDTYDNVISQIEVAEGYSLRIYSDRDYQGSYIDVKSGEKIPDLGKLSFDNKASSIRVFIDNAK